MAIKPVTMTFKDPEKYGVTAADELLLERADPPAAPKVDSNPGVEVSLPSRGKFYPNGITSVTVNPLTVAQVRNIHAAVMAGDPYTRESTFVNAIGSAIKGLSVFDLTTDDYQFLLYWLRLNSYTATPYVVTWNYERDGVTKSARSMVQMTNFDITEVDQHKIFPEGYAYPTVRDSLDLMKITDPSDQYIAEYAQYLAGGSLEEKVSRIKNMPATELPRLREHMIDSFHGIKEEASLVDPTDAQHESFKIALAVRIEDFLP